MREIKNFLVVDDSLTVRMLLKSFLTDLRPGWNSLIAESGPDALAQSEDIEIDAMLLDVNMPGMNGFELAEKLAERFPNAPITMLTANVQAKIRLRATDRGYSFLAKPVTPEKVEEIVALAEDGRD